MHSTNQFIVKPRPRNGGGAQSAQRQEYWSPEVRTIHSVRESHDREFDRLEQLIHDSQRREWEDVQEIRSLRARLEDACHHADHQAELRKELEAQLKTERRHGHDLGMEIDQLRRLLQVVTRERDVAQGEYQTLMGRLKNCAQNIRLAKAAMDGAAESLALTEALIGETLGPEVNTMDDLVCGTPAARFGAGEEDSEGNIR
jgi:chromosome segregation ATPase